MSEKNETSEVKKIDPQQRFGRKPVRELIERSIRERGATIEGLSAVMDFDDDRTLRLYLRGLALLPIDRMENLGKALDIDHAAMVRIWLRECCPDVLEVLDRLPVKILLTAPECRLINQVRTYLEPRGAELIIADGVDLVAVVVARK